MVIRTRVNPYFNIEKNILDVIFFVCSTIAISGVAYFGFLSIWFEDGSNPKSLPIFAGTGIAIAALYVFSFNPILAPNGDNAEYIINAKSLVEKGAIYRLDTRSETLNTLAAPGLPILLAPIYAKWGLDFVKMKYLIMVMGILILPLLFILFRIEMGFYLSGFLALISFSSPYLIANSTSIMTETPYLFWSILVLIFTLKFTQAPTFSVVNYLGLLFCLGMAMCTRLVGIALVLAVLVYLMQRIPLVKILKRENKWAGHQRQVTDFATVLGPILLGVFIWQWKGLLSSNSPLDVFLDMGAGQHFRDNLVSFFNVVADLFLNSGTFRWYRLSPAHTVPLFHLISIPIYLIFAIGIASDLRKGRLVAVYTFLLIMLLLIASFTPQERVMIRYISIVIPLLLYHFYTGLTVVGKSIPPRVKRVIKTPNIRLIWVFVLLMIFAVNLRGNSYNLYTKSAVYNEWYESFLNAAKWCGLHLPDDAHVMSIKPRIVYLYSGLKGRALVQERDLYSIDYSARKLEEIKRHKVSHLIVDAISNATKRNIYPILQENGQKFKALTVPDLNKKCTVVEVLTW